MKIHAARNHDEIEIGLILNRYKGIWEKLIWWTVTVINSENLIELSINLKILLFVNSFRKGAPFHLQLTVFE